MKILITGAGGWLGSELTERLLEEGNYIRAFVLFSSRKLNELKLKYSELLEIVEGDICNKGDIDKSLDGIEHVYHLAAKVHSLPKNKDEENQFFKINADASKQLFDLCIEHKVKRVIFYSTVAVYEESEEIIDVTSPKKPITAYGKSKLIAEEYGMKLFEEKGLPITIIQPVTVYGGEDVGNFEKLKSLANKGILPRFGDGENKKTVIYYKDLIRLTINIGEDREVVGKTLIIGSELISINEINRILKESCNKRVYNIRVGNRICNLLIKLLLVLNINILNKIARQIKVLKTNNIYDIEYSRVNDNSSKTFKEYYL